MGKTPKAQHANTPTSPFVKSKSAPGRESLRKYTLLCQKCNLMSGESLPCIGVGLCTYKRKEGLEAALAALAKLRVPRDVKLKLCVGDSDPARSAYKIAVSAASTFPHSLHYEATPIGHLPTRNAILEYLLQERVEYIAFCDDDAEVTPNWLEILYEALRVHQVDVVTDYVQVRIVDKRAPDWLRKHYERLLYIRPLRSPQLLSTARSGNVLFRTSVVDQLRFDTSFTDYGGDTHFFLRAYLEGARILGIAAYTITETWPLERACFRFLWQRHFTIGVRSSQMWPELMGCRGVLLSLRMVVKKGLYAFAHPWVAAWEEARRGESLSPRFFCAQGLLLLARSLGHITGLLTKSKR